MYKLFFPHLNTTKFMTRLDGIFHYYCTKDFVHRQEQVIVEFHSLTLHLVQSVSWMFLDKRKKKVKTATTKQSKTKTKRKKKRDSRKKTKKNTLIKVVLSCLSCLVDLAMEWCCKRCLFRDCEISGFLAVCFCFLCFCGFSSICVDCFSFFNYLFLCFLQGHTFFLLKKIPL